MNRSQKQKIIDREKIEKARKKRIKMFAFAGVLIIIIIVFVPTHFWTRTGNQGFSAPSEITWGKFVQVSNQDYGNTTSVYFISWYGCPIGAADSWAFYSALSHFVNMSIASPTPHYSLSSDAYPNTPGLIFHHPVSSGTMIFEPLYVYNQTLTGSATDAPFSGNPLTFGLNELASVLPPFVYSIEKDAMTTVPSSAFNGEASGTHMGHINTNVIITGHNGAWLLNGPLFSPSVLSGQNAQILMNNYSANYYVDQASTQILNTMGSVQ